MDVSLYKSGGAETATGTNDAESCLLRTVGRTMTFLGIYPYRKGHALIKDAILFYIAQYSRGNTADLYRYVAAIHDCAPKAAESNIRSAIRAAHDAGMLIRINELLGINVMEKRYPLSNLEFISLVAQYCYFADVAPTTLKNAI